jgi:hypothetical protein
VPQGMKRGRAGADRKIGLGTGSILMKNSGLSTMSTKPSVAWLKHPSPDVAVG